VLLEDNLVGIHR